MGLLARLLMRDRSDDEHEQREQAKAAEVEEVIAQSDVTAENARRVIAAYRRADEQPRHPR